MRLYYVPIEFYSKLWPRCGNAASGCLRQNLKLSIYTLTLFYVGWSTEQASGYFSNA